MGAIGGTVKNTIFQLVKSKKCVINGAKDFAEYAKKIINDPLLGQKQNHGRDSRY